MFTSFSWKYIICVHSLSHQYPFSCRCIFCEFMDSFSIYMLSTIKLAPTLEAVRDFSFVGKSSLSDVTRLSLSLSHTHTHTLTLLISCHAKSSRFGYIILSLIGVGLVWVILMLIDWSVPLLQSLMLSILHVLCSLCSVSLSSHSEHWESLLSPTATGSPPLFSHSSLTLLSLFSRSPLTLLSLPSHSSLTRLSLFSHSSLTLLSLFSRSPLALLSLSSRSPLTLLSLFSSPFHSFSTSSSPSVPLPHMSCSFYFIVGDGHTASQDIGGLSRLILCNRTHCRHRCVPAFPWVPQAENTAKVHAGKEHLAAAVGHGPPHGQEIRVFYSYLWLPCTPSSPFISTALLPASLLPYLHPPYPDFSILRLSAPSPRPTALYTSISTSSMWTIRNTSLTICCITVSVDENTRRPWEMTSLSEVTTIRGLIAYWTIRVLLQFVIGHHHRHDHHHHHHHHHHRHHHHHHHRHHHYHKPSSAHLTQVCGFSLTWGILLRLTWARWTRMPWRSSTDTTSPGYIHPGTVSAAGEVLNMQTPHFSSMFM